MAKTYYSRKNALTMSQKRGARKSAYRTLSRPRYSIPSRLNYGVGRGLGLAGQLVTVTKNVFKEDYLTSALTGPMYLGMDFKLSDISDYTHYQQVYEEYRINWVKVTYIPKINSIGSGATVGVIPSVTTYSAQCGLLGTAIDLDSGTITTPFTTFDQMCQADSFKFSRGTDLHTRVLRPAIMTVVSNTANGSGINGGTPSRAQWIALGAPSVPHYGLRVMVEDSDVIAMNYDVIVKYNISFRCVH